MWLLCATQVLTITRTELEEVALAFPEVSKKLRRRQCRLAVRRAFVSSAESRLEHSLDHRTCALLLRPFHTGDSATLLFSALTLLLHLPARLVHTGDSASPHSTECRHTFSFFRPLSTQIWGIFWRCSYVVLGDCVCAANRCCSFLDSVSTSNKGEAATAVSMQAAKRVGGPAGGLGATSGATRKSLCFIDRAEAMTLAKAGGIARTPAAGDAGLSAGAGAMASESYSSAMQQWQMPAAPPPESPFVAALRSAFGGGQSDSPAANATMAYSEGGGSAGAPVWSSAGMMEATAPTSSCYSRNLPPPYNLAPGMLARGGEHAGGGAGGAHEQAGGFMSRAVGAGGGSTDVAVLPTIAATLQALVDGQARLREEMGLQREEAQRQREELAGLTKALEMRWPMELPARAQARSGGLFA